MECLDESKFEPDYEDEIDGVKTEVEPAKKKKKPLARQCEICNVSTVHLYRHRFRHLPSELDHRVPQCSASYAPFVIKLLLCVAKSFGLVSVLALFEFCQVYKFFVGYSEAITILDKEQPFFKSVCDALELSTPSFRMNPVNSPALLAHTSLIARIVQLSPSLNYYMPKFHINCAGSSNSYLSDSRLYVHVMRQANSEFTTLSSLLTPGTFEFKFVLSIFDSDLWPSSNVLSEAHSFDRRLFFAFGASPSQAKELYATVKKRSNELRLLDDCHYVLAFGVIGLDFSAGCTSADKHYQVKVLKVFLRFYRATSSSKPMVLLCKDLPNCKEAFSTLLDLLSYYQISKFHRISLTNFTYDVSVLRSWLSVYPNTVFNISPLHFRGRAAFTELIRSVPTHSFLLESGAPYQSASPAVLESIARWLSSDRNMSLPMFVSQVFSNVHQFYGLSDNPNHPCC